MVKYRIEIENGKHPHPVVITEEKKYELAGEFLLAEGRNFGREILAAMNEVCSGERQESGFSGNVFSLEITRGQTRITHDISDRTCEIGTEALKKMLKEYLTVWQKQVKAEI